MSRVTITLMKKIKIEENQSKNYKIMKKSFLITGNSILLAVALLCSCQSSSEKVEQAENEVEKAKEELTNSKSDLNEAQQDFIVEYQQFVSDAEMKIQEQEKKIADYKIKMATDKKKLNSESNSELATLENKSVELKERLANFKNEGQEKWVEFKKELNLDIEKLGEAYMNFTKNSNDK